MSHCPIALPSRHCPGEPHRPPIGLGGARCNPAGQPEASMTAPSSGVTRVVMADAYPICLKGAQIELCRVEGASVVACAFSSSQLFDVLALHECDVLVTEYVMGPTDIGDGLGMFKRIRQRYPSLKMVVLTAIGNPVVHAALEDLGVRAIVSKRDLPEHLRRAVQAAARSEAYLSPGILAARRAGRTRQKPAGYDTLTRAEVEVVRLLLSGLSLGEIAGVFRRSKQTVSAQKRAAMRKLDVHSDAGLVRYGVRSGLAA